MDAQYTKINDANWLQVVDSRNNDMYPYEPNSIMHYGSYAFSTDTSIPVMTYKDGSTFGDSVRMTTTDSLQVIWAYCNDDADKGNPKDNVSCPSVDQVGYTRPVYVDRLCDGKLDCHNGEDENGWLAKCIPEALIETGNSAGCCKSYIVKKPFDINAIEYKFEEGSYPYTHGNWVNPDNSSELLLRFDVVGPYEGTWMHAVAGEPGDEEVFSYTATSNEINPTNTACPPTDKMWHDSAGNQFSVLCKSSGPEVYDVQKCQDAKCDPVATCIDTVIGYTCKCPSTHYGNGITCTEHIIEDECLNGNHDCPEICNDQVIGFSCSCQDDQIDAEGDGRICKKDPKCCETFSMGIDGRNDIQLMCSMRETNEFTGMMDYTCEPNREFSAYKPLLQSPAVIQYLSHAYVPGYYLMTGTGLLAEPWLETRPMYVTRNEPRLGAVCPSIKSSDWETSNGLVWSFKCFDYTYILDPEFQPDHDECATGDNNCDLNAICTNIQGGFYCNCMAGFTGDGVNCKPLEPFSFG